jgi:tRNA(fMet)-specific endonuclease VapC
MSRYLLDTNIIIFFITNRFKEDVSSDIKSILQDYSNILYTSSVSVLELLQLCRIGKVKLAKGVKPEHLSTIIESDFNIKIQPFTTQNLHTLSKLSISEGHNDPFDHAIIAQAISEKMILISSDTKFENYTKQKL